MSVASISFRGWKADVAQFILSRTGWVYPPNSIIGTIFLVPIEEHLFFILQPIFLVLLHALISHPRLLPFELPSALAEYKPTQDQEIDLGRKEEDRPIRAAMTRTIQTLPRRPLAAAFWSGVFLAGAVLINEAHGFVPDLVPLQLGTRAFYLGWILVWISPVIGGLSWLGSNTGRDEWRAWAVGSAWLCMVDTYVPFSSCSTFPDDVTGWPFVLVLGEYRRRRVSACGYGEGFLLSE